MVMTASAVDLFCGAGGLTHGFIKEGVSVNAGIDLDPACRYPFEFNNRSRFIEKDITKVSVAELRRLYPKGQIRILAGCAPCQPFSTYTNGLKAQEDVKWGLLSEFSRLAVGLRPEIVTMENVPNLRKHAVFHEFKQALVDAGYRVSVFIVDCSLYRIPQKRKRLVLLASRLGTIDLVPPPGDVKKPVTVRKIIGKLPAIRAGEQWKRDRMHKASTLSDLNMRRIRASTPGGTWRDWEESLVAECHKKKTGKTFPGVYARMEWDAPGPTITTQFFGFGNGRFGHPDQDRAISLREGAMLQTFPKGYRFVDPSQEVQIKAVGRLIGNAVPVRLGRVVAKSIARHLESVGGTENDTVRRKPKL